jgi:hypothetical protein
MPRPRRTVYCMMCNYKWRTRYQDRGKIFCPKCKKFFKEIMQPAMWLLVNDFNNVLSKIMQECP